jgi:tetratricopeptide (TPR) repeat protein
LKTITYRHLLVGLLLIFLVACSTKRNSFLSRNMHALSTRDNILYNGGLALDKGVADLKTTYSDNFWEILPVERMQPSTETTLPGQTSTNPDFERAETKAVKAIQKHSMNIDSSEKNPQMDEAHLMLGKARYYEKRYVPALEAFNYVLYKYPSSDKIYEVKIWRERTNMRLENDEQAITNLRKLLKEIKFKDQIFADANATLAQAFINIEEKDSAIAKLKIATNFTKEKEEVARYKFILAQLYESRGDKDSAFASYQEVIDMKRKSPKQYVIHAHARQAAQFDFEKGDTLAFVEKYNDLLKDRENRPFLDVLNHQMALFYDKGNQLDVAKKFYNKSLNSKPKDQYLIASNYRNLADLYFRKAKYVTAGKYFDSTLAILEPRSREHKLISKKRDNLEDVIKYEGIAQRNDSILKLAKMSGAEREAYFNEYIAKVKEADQKAKEELENKMALEEQNNAQNNLGSSTKSPDKIGPKTSASTDFYFYNPTTVAYGRTEFVKKWGKRKHTNNWRLSSLQKTKGPDAEKENEEDDNETKEEVANVDPRYSTDFYTKQLPSSSKDLDSIAKERNFAYFQLGVVYKEKFREYKLAVDKFEGLLQNSPEERLVLPSMYNLYKIYEITDPAKAALMKAQIIAEHPSSRYAQILSDNKVSLELGSPEVVFSTLFKEYESGLYRETLVKTDMAIVEFAGEDLLPKFELLKANLIGRLHGLTEYKKALNFVALTYPNNEVGKETEKFIAGKIPLLESLYFNDEIPTSWKIIYQPKSLVEKDNKVLLDKLNKLAKERTIETLTVSTDVYTLERNLIVVHGIKSEENAKGLAQILKEFKDYKIADPATIISSENYKVVQVFKNLDEYLAGKGPNFEPKQKPVIQLPKEEVKQEKPKAVREQKEEPTTPETKGENVKSDSKPMQNNGKEGARGNQNNNEIPPQPQFNITPPSSGNPPKSRG